MDMGKMLMQDRQIKGKPRKIHRTLTHMKIGAENAPQLRLAANGEEELADREVSLKTIHTEIKSFWQDNKQQFGEIKEEISKTKLRLD